MSKWLRRGFGQNNSSNNTSADERQPPQQTEFPTPPRNDMPAATAVAAYQTSQQQQHQSQMVGFETSVAMDVDNGQSSRSKYAQPPSSYHHPPSSSAPKPYESSRSSRQMPDDHRNSSQSSRQQSSRERRSSRSSYSQQPRPGATSAPPPPSSSAHVQQHHQQAPPSGHFGSPPPQQQATPYGHKDPLGNSTPPETAQPSFPPPAVTADSPQPSEASQRRPAYLLHRDLVIGKGSYGQVCIASRGEPEGHSSGRSGKRKKFACKCVMLRNDPKYIAKLQEEVNVLRELRGHQNVIRLYDVFCVDNELFIITELGRGGDLFHLLTTHPKHGVTEAYAGRLLLFLLAPTYLLFLNLLCGRTHMPHFLFLPSQPKRSPRCFLRLHSCTLEASVIGTSNWRTGFSNPGRTCGAH